MSALHTMSRARRRLLVLIMQLGMAAYALALALTGMNSLWLFLLILSLQVLYMVIFFRFLRPIMKEVDREAADLDECQIAVRNSAHHDAYQILAVILMTITALPLAASLYAGISLRHQPPIIAYALASTGPVLLFHEPDHLATRVSGRVDATGPEAR